MFNFIILTLALAYFIGIIPALFTMLGIFLLIGLLTYIGE